MTVIISAATELIFCNGCGAVSINTPAFDWKRYRHKDICHHCPSCQEYNYLVSMGLVSDRTAVVYEDWKVTTP